MGIELDIIVELFLNINTCNRLLSASGIKRIQRYFFSTQLYMYKLLILLEKIESVTIYSDDLLTEGAHDFPDFVHQINAGIYHSYDILSVMLDRRRNLLFYDPFKQSLMAEAKKGAELDIVMLFERLLSVAEKINTYLGVELMPSCEIKRGRKDLQELKILITQLQEYVHSIDPASITNKKKADVVLINIEAFLTRISIYIATIDYATRIMQDHYELYKEQQRPGSLMKKYSF